ncbi:acetolactate synthase large subunit [Microbacterium halophytorum]|uniref:acetolactate synthase large subunit n=1 Tax=Microbacterium halophytorum TaxID=2067568 RepID=UPI000CFACBCD|nr:acetolactate synthase large subunit [Microbacterium halophytorum]
MPSFSAAVSGVPASPDPRPSRVPVGRSHPPSARPVLTGAEAVVRTLELLGITDVFGIPGGAVLPVYDALTRSHSLRHVLVRHEQGAGHAAEGYAAASGRVGVALSSSGPGATNLVTPIMDAKSDSVPLLVITGQVRSELRGTDAFQEADIEGITLPITKHSTVVTAAADIPRVLCAAYRLAHTGRPGPVLVDITRDALTASADFVWPPPGHDTADDNLGRVSSTQIGRAAHEIGRAKRPVLYVGGGVIRADAAAELVELAELVSAPVVTTLMARGVFPDSHPLNLGMPGMHGTVPAVLALQESDLIVAIGTRFDERVTGDASLFAPNARVVHIDIDPAEISKIRRADVPIVADARAALPELTQAVRAVSGSAPRTLSSWWARLHGLQREFPLGYAPTSDGLIAPQHVIRRIGELTGPEAVYTAGVGQHQMWAAQFLPFERPRQWINSGGAGTMGYAVPAALGAKTAEPGRVVWAIDGDGSFQMTNQELATCAINGIPIKVAIINNSALGMIRQWQTLVYGERYSQSALHTGHESVRIPDFVRLADAYGCAAMRVEREVDIDRAIHSALAINDRPVVIDFVVSGDAMVWPMVPQGVGNDRIRYAREHERAFEHDN